MSSRLSCALCQSVGRSCRFPHKNTSQLNLLSTKWRSKVTVSNTKANMPSKPTSGEISRIRNIGIMAHIDAGKTTTTERFLYYSGVIRSPGEVHHGDTVTDFLPQERERGITIQSAVVTFPWRNHVLNLIDTPGHVDFTFEVQRSLRVVDSAVAIVDASAGVEAQTLTVWRQATDYLLPRLIYLNKMDKKAASVDLSLESIRSKLKCIPFLLQLPVYDKSPQPRSGSGSGLNGIIDLVELKRHTFDQATKGAAMSEIDLSGDKVLLTKRCELIEQVADLDSQLANRIIETESVEGVTKMELYLALRRLTLSNQAVPVLIGSSYKNIGVQPLMDSILKYLPHPGESVIKDPVLHAYGHELCSFAFKTIHSEQLGPLTFLRIFSGSLIPGQKVYNVTRGKHEKVAKVYFPLAEELSETAEGTSGQVVIVSGLKETVTGDTLTLSHSVASSVVKKLGKMKGHKGPEDHEEGEEVKAVLSGVTVPQPVFFCSVEASSLSQQKQLDFALECMQREDPSLHLHTDPDTNQMILSGMGELHLDIIHSRLNSEFGVEADLGKIQVAYRETISSPVTKRIIFERRLADQKHSVTIQLELTPLHGVKSSTSTSKVSKLKLYKGRDKDKSENLSHLQDKHRKHIQNGIDSAQRFGPKLSFPVSEVEVTLHWFEQGRGTSDTIVEAATASCFRQCLEEAVIYLLEPMVSLEVTVEGSYQRVVLDDLNRRRFMLQGVDVRHGNNVIEGTAPLSELVGYSTILRTISSGLGTFSMHFSHYQLVTSLLEEQKIVNLARGFS